jgi:Holliday junction resolvase-like predicted endonuclease
VNDISEILKTFILQSRTGELKTSIYPKEWNDFKMSVSFGMGTPARVPWISFLGTEMLTSNGIYPVYLYYKNLDTLILAYGVSETQESVQLWPAEILGSAQTVSAFFDQKVPRYGNSFIFKTYKITAENDSVTFADYGSNKQVTKVDLESDLSTILEYYRKVISMPSAILVASEIGQGIFYMEKQLEDFIIHNWNQTELGEKYDLLIEEGDLLSQLFRTDIGPIDILAKDKKCGSYVVIELKRNQTSDDTVGQLARYMGWIKEHKNDKNVRGVIIAGQYDKKLDYAREMIPNIEVFIYQVDFKLSEFKK